MYDILVNLTTLLLLAFIVGMINPKFIMRWAPEDKRNRKWVLIVTFICLFIFGSLGNIVKPNKEKVAQQAKQEQQLQENEVKENTEEKKEIDKEQAKGDVNRNVSAVISIDWDRAIADTKNDIIQQETLVKDVYINVDQSKKSIEIALACNNAIKQEAAAEAADTAVRRLSANAQMQDSTIKSGGKDYWGGIWDVYELRIAVARTMDIEKRSKWLIDDVVQPKVQGYHKFKGLKRM